MFPSSQPSYTRKIDLNMDEKKLRRIISNRLSAHRSRARTNEYIKHMERKVTDLQNLISFLNLQIAGYKAKQNEMLLQNDSLQKLVELQSNKAQISEFELEQSRLEIGRLKEVAWATKTTRYGSDLASQK